MDNDDDYVPSPPEVKEKFCNRCGRFKPLKEFYTRKGGGDQNGYLYGYCRTCHNTSFKREQICCPHCKERIAFIGVDTRGGIIKQKTDVIIKMKRLVKEEMKAARAKSKEIRDRKKRALTNLSEEVHEEEMYSVDNSDIPVKDFIDE